MFTNAHEYESWFVTVVDTGYRMCFTIDLKSHTSLREEEKNKLLKGAQVNGEKVTRPKRGFP